MARRKQTAELIRGHAAHRRTEGDYMGVLLDAVTLEDWRDVVNNAKAMAKALSLDVKSAEAMKCDIKSLAGIAQAPGCNIEAAQRRLITAQLLGVKAVPWIVRGDGTLRNGMPPDLAAWLAAGSPS